MSSRERILVALSGGVDSSVAAGLLCEAGYDVVGVTLHLWDAHGEGRVGRCCSPEDRDDARRTCEHLGIPHYVFDEREAFRENVVDPFLDAYRAGETPSPCVHCNTQVKLGPLRALAERLGASRVATGHYARLDLDAHGHPRLLRGRDTDKDQSYFLYGVDPEVLRAFVFPLGDRTKAETREEARRLRLPNADKPDSQELCFVPDGDVAGFVRRERGAGRAGSVVDADGNVLAAHDGIEGFTVGQRRGLGVGGGPPRYVLRIVPERDEVVVGDQDALLAGSLDVARASWLAPPPSEPFEGSVRVRYRASLAEATIVPTAGGGFRARFRAPQRAITPGQAAVVYRGDEVLGGGLIV